MAFDRSREAECLQGERRNGKETENMSSAASRWERILDRPNHMTAMCHESKHKQSVGLHVFSSNPQPHWGKLEESRSLGLC